MQYLIDNKVPPKNKYDISLQDIIKNNDKAILDSAFETIKQNYKCPKGTVDDSNKCDIEKPIVNIPIPNKFKDIDNVKSDKIRGESSEFLNQLVQNNEYLVNSLKSYTNIGHLEVNKYLGNRISGNIPKETEKIIIGLDSIFNLQKEQNFLTSSSITTYRGVSDIEIENLLGLNQKHIYDIEPGKIITDPKFVSTTLNKEQALQFGRDRYGGSIITILIPKNSEALHTESVSGSEDELLINRNQSYKFLGVNKNIDNSGLDSNKPVHEFIFELVNANQKQSSSHLSDAVETIKLNYNCPDSEKNGTGPGSCGGNTNSKINRNPEIAPADYNSFFENFNKISKDKSEPDRVMRRLNAETVQRRFYRKTEEHFNEIKPENDKKLKENGEKLWDNLKPEVQSAIKSYTTQDYGVINSALQDDITREEVSLIKEATSKPLGVSTILYRGINFKMPKDIFKVGATWIHKPFASCSTGSFIAEEAASGKLTHITPEEKTILQIFTEPETKGFAVGKNSFYAGADAGSEVILDAGTKFQTIHSEKRGGMRILTVRAINDKQKQDSSYLEDVTNFIKLNYNCPDSEKNGSGPGSCGGKTESHVLNLESRMRQKITEELPELEKNLASRQKELAATDKNSPAHKKIKSEVTTLKKRITGGKKFIGSTNKEVRPEDFKKPDDAPNINNVMEKYQNYTYKIINNVLRGDTTIKQTPEQEKATKQLIATMDKEMLSHTQKTPITVFRADGGSVTSAIFEKIGIGDQPSFKLMFGKEKFDMEDLAIDRVNGNKIEKSLNNLLVGEKFTEKGFMSTGKVEKNIKERFLNGSTQLHNYGIESLLEIEVPKGISALRMLDYTGISSELGGKIDEYVIDRDQTMVIKNVKIITNDNGRVYLHMKVSIEPNQKHNSSYLNEVVDFIKLNYKCPKGTVDDTNACGLEGQESKTKINDQFDSTTKSIIANLQNLDKKSSTLEHGIVWQDNKIIETKTGEEFSVGAYSSDIEKSIKDPANFGKYNMAHTHPSGDPSWRTLMPSGGDIEYAAMYGGIQVCVTKDYIYKYEFPNNTFVTNFPDKWRFKSKSRQDRESEAKDFGVQWNQLMKNIIIHDKEKGIFSDKQYAEKADKVLSKYAEKIGMKYRRIPRT